MSRLADERGVMLTELLVAMTLMLVISGAVLTCLEVFQRTTGANQLQNEAQDRARLGVERLLRDLRNHATPSPALPTGIERAGPYDLITQTVDPGAAPSNARGSRRVRYCLTTGTSGARLHAMTQDWSGAPPAVPATTACPGPTADPADPSAGWSAQRVVADSIANRSGTRPLFSYDSAALADVSEVKADLWVDVDPALRPGEVALRGGVLLRNRNRAPTAAFTVTRTARDSGGSYHVLLNGSGSTDPDGDALAYEWRDGATLIPSAAAWLDHATPAGTHRFTLTVRDPSGLAHSAPEREVTLP